MSMHEFEDLVEASVRTVARSVRHSRHELRALYWYALLAPYLLFTFSDEEVPKLMTFPSLTSLKHRYYSTEAHHIQLGDYGAFRRPTPEEMDEMETGRVILSWWFQPL